MAAILRDSTVVVVVVVVVAVVRTRPRAIPLSMINHEKIHTWVSFSYMVMGLRLAALRAAGAPLLLKPEGNTGRIPATDSNYGQDISLVNYQRFTTRVEIYKKIMSHNHGPEHHRKQLV